MCDFDYLFYISFSLAIYLFIFYFLSLLFSNRAHKSHSNNRNNLANAFMVFYFFIFSISYFCVCIFLLLDIPLFFIYFLSCVAEQFGPLQIVGNWFAIGITFDFRP